MNDGVIKYSQTSHLTQPLTDFNSYEALEECRSQLAKLDFIGVYPNGVGYGNISARDGFCEDIGDRAFVITGSQTGDLKSLTKNDYVRVISYNTKKLTMSSQGVRRASSESLTHAAIYDANESIRCVIHIHNNKLWKLMLEGAFPKISKDVEYGTKEMALSVGALFHGVYHCVFVTEGHEDGVFVVGSSVSEAMENLMELCRKLKY